MRNIKNNIWIPDVGYKYITNGDIYASEIQFGVNQHIEEWHDTNDELPSPTPEEESTTYYENNNEQISPE